MKFYPALIVGLILIGQSGFAFITDSSQRKEFFEVDSGSMVYQKAFDATVSLFTPENLATIAKPTFFHRPKNVSRLLPAPLCSDEDLAKEPSASYCSGVLITPRIVLTAGHCVSKDLCDQMKIAFRYRLKGRSDLEKVTPDQVYGCEGFVGGTSRPEEISGKVTENADDYALILLDRAVADHDPVEVDLDFRGEKRPVFAVSTPFGTPQKLIDGGNLFGPGDLPMVEHDLLLSRDDNQDFMATDLSQGPGSSGGPVFDARTGKLLALTSQGPTREFYLDRDSKGSACEREVREHSRTFDYSGADSKWEAIGNAIKDEQDPGKRKELAAELNALYAHYVPMAPGLAFRISAIPHLADYVGSSNPAKFLSFDMDAERAALRARMGQIVALRKLYEAPLVDFPKSDLVGTLQGSNAENPSRVAYLPCFDVTGMYSKAAVKKTRKYSLMLSPQGDSEILYPRITELFPETRLGAHVLAASGRLDLRHRFETVFFRTEGGSFFVEHLERIPFLKFLKRKISGLFDREGRNPIRMERSARWKVRNRLFCPADPEKWKGLVD